MIKGVFAVNPRDMKPIFMKTCAYLFCFAVLPFTLGGCSDRVDSNVVKKTMSEPEKEPPAKIESGKKPGKAPAPAPATEVATLGAGCFWCIEAVLEQVKGISDVTSGYMGGAVPNPTYEQICTGLTGHAEVVQVTFDPAVIDFAGVLENFWKLHDPTTLNRQGNDVGTQYRSAIFFHSQKQKEIAEAAIKKKDEAGVFRSPIVTEVSALEKFYEAEKYHQDYYRNNKAVPYCQFVITPKLDKLGLEK